jgi:IclR family acetate operon transcriptional repressor
MTSLRDRPLAVLDLLARHVGGLPMTAIADRLDIPRSATHRLLGDLKDTGYVRQVRDGGDYVVTAKVVSIAIAYLDGHGITDIAQPILDQAAVDTGELIRLAIIDNDKLTWVAKAQGARHGLRYDPDAGSEVYLAATANGYAWLSCLDDDEAMQLVAKQGLKRDAYGPGAPKTLKQVLDRVRQARKDGYGVVHEAYEPGTSAVATPICRPGTKIPIGTISAAGPTLRMTPKRLIAIAPILMNAAADLGATSSSSALFSQSRKGPNRSAA